MDQNELDKKYELNRKKDIADFYYKQLTDLIFDHTTEEIINTVLLRENFETEVLEIINKNKDIYITQLIEILNSKIYSREDDSVLVDTKDLIEYEFEFDDKKEFLKLLKKRTFTCFKMDCWLEKIKNNYIIKTKPKQQKIIFNK